MRENLGNHRRIFDRGDALQAAAALRAVFNIDIEYAFEQARPTHTRRGATRGRVIGGTAHRGMLGEAVCAGAIVRALTVAADRKLTQVFYFFRLLFLGRSKKVITMKMLERLRSD